jgi:hypothetical protein
MLEQHITDRGLRDASKVALLVGQPLLITGELRTVETQLSSTVEFELGLPPLVIIRRLHGRHGIFLRLRHACRARESDGSAAGIVAVLTK